MAAHQVQSLLSPHQKIPTRLSMKRRTRDIVEKQIRVLEKELSAQPVHQSFYRSSAMFLSLALTTAISSTLLIADRQGWVLSASLYHITTKNRASVQIAIQLLANALGLCQVSAICVLINRATRLHFGVARATMNDLQFWSHLCSQSIGWQLPLMYLIPLSCFLGLMMFPSALWAGALSPISTLKSYDSTIIIPSYANSSFIKEYPSEFPNANETLLVRNSKGVFAYRVGIVMEGALLSSASSATSVDGSPRKHTKLDNSGFTYIGRSYGVGAAVGLQNSDPLDDSFTTSYTYAEPGLMPEVRCIYNSSSQFLLTFDGSILFEARGALPNSNGGGEDSTYIGHNSNSIVAIGVAAVATNGTQFMAITSGLNYETLNMTQCSIDYIPTLFNVTVDANAKNITVSPAIVAESIDPAGNIIHAATRQLELISNDQTNLYQSLLGNSFMSSIADYNISQTNSSLPNTQENSTLAGLTNSVSAMLDDILVGYGSAQVMVGNQSTTTEVAVTALRLKLGQRIYIFAIFALNLVVVVVVIEEVVRTKLWKGLQEWDYMDIEEVIVSSFKGGRSMSDGSTHDTAYPGPRFGMKLDHTRDNFEDVTGQSTIRLDRSSGTLLLEDWKEGKEGFI